MRRLVAVLVLLLAATAVRAEVSVPPPDLVVDQVGVLTPEARKNVEDLLRALGAASHPAVMAILVVDHVPDGDIEGYALAVGRTWKLGQAGIDNGLLLVHAVGDHRYRFEVGPGLQGDLRRAYIATIWAIAERLGNPEAVGKADAPPPQAEGESAPAAPQVAPAVEPGPPAAAADDTGFYATLAVLAAIVVLAIVLRRSYLLAAGSAAALSAGTMTLFGQQIYDILGFSLAASLFGALMVLVARHPAETLEFFFNLLFNSLSRSSSSSSSGSSSDSGVSGGGSFDGGGASGRTD